MTNTQSDWILCISSMCAIGPFRERVRFQALRSNMCYPGEDLNLTDFGAQWLKPSGMSSSSARSAREGGRKARWRKPFGMWRSSPFFYVLTIYYIITPQYHIKYNYSGSATLQYSLYIWCIPRRSVTVESSMPRNSSSVIVKSSITGNIWILSENPLDPRQSESMLRPLTQVI